MQPVGPTSAVQQYQSPQRKSTNKNKRVSVRSPKNFCSDILSVTSGSDSESSSSGVQTIGDDTSESDKSAASALVQRVRASTHGYPSEQRGGRKYGTPLRRSRGRAADRHPKSTTSDHSVSSSESSDSDVSIDSEGGDTARCVVDKHDGITPTLGTGVSSFNDNPTGRTPPSPPKVQRGRSTKSTQRTPTPDEKDTIKGSMLEGVWPGGQDIQLVQRFVTMHFGDDWATYMYFAQWADRRRSGDSSITVRLEDWLSVDKDEETYRLWITKHVSEFCGTNVQQYYWSKGDVSPKCDFCGDHGIHNPYMPMPISRPSSNVCDFSPGGYLLDGQDTTQLGTIISSKYLPLG